jgi:EmrB/QacA subfamily drug resistance transporter
MNATNVRKWGGLAVLTLALAIIVIDQTLINVSLRTIVRDLHTTIHSLQWVITGYALTLSAFTIAGGRLGDLFGRKRMFMIGAVTFACGAIIASTAHTVAQLMIGASVVEGLGAAMMMPATTSLLLANFQGRERAIAFGVWGGVAGAAAALGPLVGGYLTTYYSWRYGYGINLVIVSLLLLFSWLVVDSRENVKRRKVDFVGIALSALGLASIVYGIVQSSTDGWFHAKGLADLFGHYVNLGTYSEVPFMIALGILILVIFAMWEYIVQLRGGLPLVSLKMFRNLPFVAGIVTLAIVAMGQFGAIFALPVFFQTVRGLTAFQTGLAFLPFSLAAFFSAPLAGALGSSKIRPKYIIVTGLLIDTLGIYLVHNGITATATAASLRLPLIIFGVGLGISFAQIINVTLSAVNVQEAGEASGISNTFRQIGATMGNAVIGSILIAALTSNYTADIRQSTALPAQLKPAIQRNVKAEVQSLGQSAPVAGKRPLPAPIMAELNRIKDDATARGVRHAFGYGVGIVAFGVLASPHQTPAGPPAERTDTPSPAPPAAPPSPQPEPVAVAAVPDRRTRKSVRL